jgi:hypothetical protein
MRVKKKADFDDPFFNTVEIFILKSDTKIVNDRQVKELHTVRCFSVFFFFFANKIGIKTCVFSIFINFLCHTLFFANFEAKN